MAIYLFSVDISTQRPIIMVKSNERLQIFFIRIPIRDITVIHNHHIHCRKYRRECSMLHHDYRWLLNDNTQRTASKTRKDLVFGMESAHIIIMASCIIYDGETISKNTDKCSLYCRMLMLTGPTFYSRWSKHGWLLCVPCATAAALESVYHDENGGWKKKRSFSSRLGVNCQRSILTIRFTDEQFINTISG